MINSFILGKKIYTATKIEFKEANKTDAAEQSFATFAKRLNFLSTIRSTIDSMDVFKSSKSKTEIIVEMIIINSI